MLYHIFSPKRIMERLRALQGNQSGAVAMLVMAATLVVLMMSLVLFDAGFAARDKIDIQVAADTAAWSQAAVEARSMNLLAFTNVAKRVTFGMMAFYEALWMAWAAILAMAIALTIACWIANVFALGSLSTICTKLTEFTVEVGVQMAKEAPDLATYLGNLRSNYFQKDIEALDNYQNYLTRLTPWWGWAEGMMRGSRNGALISSSFPVPKDYISGLPGGSNPDSAFSGTGLEDSLPVERDGRDYLPAMNEICWPVYSELDIIAHEADYLYKSFSQWKSNWKTGIAFPLAGLMAAGFLYAGCLTATIGGDDNWRAYMIKSHANAQRWQLSTSTLAFAYEPNLDRMSADGERGKYEYLSADYTSLPLLYDAGGYWAISRAEFAYQNNGEAPDLWHASYTARMRPVALTNEWSGLGSSVTMTKAYRDVLPYILGGAALLGALDGVSSGEFDFENLLGGGAADLLRIELAVRALSDANMAGVVK